MTLVNDNESVFKPINEMSRILHTLIMLDYRVVTLSERRRRRKQINAKRLSNKVRDKVNRTRQRGDNKRTSDHWYRSEDVAGRVGDSSQIDNRLIRLQVLARC